MRNNSSRLLYQTFLKKGLNKEDAFFAVLDHFNELHWYDRNMWADRVKKLEEENAKLKVEAGQPPS